MSKIYKVPPDIRIKEKVIGGILTLAQAGWIAGGLVLGLILFLITFTLSKFLAVSLFIISTAIGLPFAFYKKEQLTLFQYLKYKHQFKKKSKFIINKRSEVIDK